MAETRMRGKRTFFLSIELNDFLMSKANLRSGERGEDAEVEEGEENEVDRSRYLCLYPHLYMPPQQCFEAEHEAE